MSATNSETTPPPAGKTALVFIFITILLDSIGFGLIGPVMPNLITELTGEGPEVGVKYGGYLYITYAAMQFFCSPLLGGLSDRFGRRGVLLASMFALGCDYLIMALAPSFAWLFVGRLIAGVAGATYTPAYAYIADVTAPEKRAQSFGLLGVAFGGGFIIGPTLGGLLGDLGTRVPFYAAGVIALANFLFGYFVLPESLALNNRRPFDWRRANPLGTVLQLRKYPTILPMLFAALLWMTAMQVLPTTWSFFAELRFNWTPMEIGLSLGFAGVTMMISQGLLTRILLPRLGGENRSAMVGLIGGALTFLGYAFATQGWMIYASMLLWLLAGLIWPSMNGLLSRQIPANAQGELQGGMGSIGSVAAIIGPPLMTQTLGYFSSDAAPVKFEGAAFVVAAMLALASLAVLMFALRRSPRQRI
jgi:DHA1 family tetracycline resistance protein-like MFS transporter